MEDYSLLSVFLIIYQQEAIFISITMPDDQEELVTFTNQSSYILKTTDFIIVLIRNGSTLILIDNSAGDNGGIWYLDVRALQNQNKSFFLKNTTIEKSSAFKSIYFFVDRK